jgi:hypothetical protein
VTRRTFQHGILAAFLASLTSLAGCLDVTEEIRVNGDGSGRLYVDLAVSEKVTALAALAGSPSAVPFHEDDLRAALAASDNIESFTVSTRQDDGMTHTEVTALVKDFTRPLPSLKAPEADGSANEEALVPFTIRRLGNKNLHFVHELTAMVDSANKQATGLLAGLALADRHLTVRLYGKIISANGRIADDKLSVEWRIPLSQLFAGTTVIRQLEAEIAPPAFAGLTTVLFVGLAVALLAIVAVVQFRRRLL